MEEIWVNIAGAEGRYQVSHLGNVKSTTNVNSIGKVMQDHPKIIKQHKNTKGYLYVNMVINGISCMKPIHRLIAETFLPNPLKLNCVNHINCNKLDNRICNLEWCTLEYNTSHAHKNGKFPNPTGIKNGGAKITEEIALFIFNSKKSAKDLAKELNINRSRVYDVRSGQLWSHVTGLPNNNYRKKMKKVLK